MVEYKPQVEAADKLADCVDSFLREKCSLANLTTALLTYRAAQVLVDEELKQAFDKLQEQMQPILDYEQKQFYNEATNKQAKDSKKERS